MPIESYKRFWQLSLIPTHSKESLNELHEYVRRAIIREIVLSDSGNNLCDYCANKRNCEEGYAHYNYCEAQKKFQLRMENE